MPTTAQVNRFMTRKLKLLLVAGARPNFMKIAPLVRAVLRHNQARRDNETDIDWRLVHTGQHYDEKMSAVFFRELGIPMPNINLDVGSGSHATQTANVMARFEPVCLQEHPDWVVVVGDVNSTMACTLVATKLGIKVAHVEAGLRSFDRSMPEELNRLVTDALADVLLTPSPDADENLKREGIPQSRIRLVGNIMIDSLVQNLEQARQSLLPRELGVEGRAFAYVTLHRPSNVDHRGSLSAIMTELETLSRRMPVIFPIHPRTRKRLEEFGITISRGNGLHLLDPVGYHDSLSLTEKARLVLTDSGGLQEESTFFCTPCLTLRPNTERPVTITTGSNRLTDVLKLSADLDQVLSAEERIGKVPPLWDGHTAERILKVLADPEREDDLNARNLIERTAASFLSPSDGPCLSWPSHAERPTGT
jgi:UDP-N-acetylglucosamine 2-epimerase (non-hydrolysing)